MWDLELKSWSRNFRVIAPDFRGFGDSPMSEGEFSMAGCVEDVVDLVVSLGIRQKIVLLGLSMGGYVCFEFARRYPDMLCGLILVGTQPTADSDAAKRSPTKPLSLFDAKGLQPSLKDSSPVSSARRR
jgi:pimeloyl-ACP methyl ester carboxylesterase